MFVSGRALGGLEVVMVNIDIAMLDLDLDLNLENVFGLPEKFWTMF
jgi:hypothetical protein